LRYDGSIEAYTNSKNNTANNSLEEAYDETPVGYPAKYDRSPNANHYNTVSKPTVVKVQPVVKNRVYLNPNNFGNNPANV